MGIRQLAHVGKKQTQQGSAVRCELPMHLRLGHFHLPAIGQVVAVVGAGTVRRPTPRDGQRHDGGG
jgi:hypothetical protein